jgi:predicted lactoylglutathione lyase
MELNQSVITNKGRTLMAMLLSGHATATFTKISISSTVYASGDLAALTVLTNVKQTATCQAKPNNGATVSVEAAFNNTGLTAGYDVNTIGVYATDPDEGEIL